MPALARRARLPRQMAMALPRAVRSSGRKPDIEHPVLGIELPSRHMMTPDPGEISQPADAGQREQ